MAPGGHWKRPALDQPFARILVKAELPLKDLGIIQPCHHTSSPKREAKSQKQPGVRGLVGPIRKWGVAHLSIRMNATARGFAAAVALSVGEYGRSSAASRQGRQGYRKVVDCAIDRSFERGVPVSLQVAETPSTRHLIRRPFT